MSDRVLVTARDPHALMASVSAALGASLDWVGMDDPATAGVTVWLASSAPPATPLRLPALRWIHTGWAGVDHWLGRPEWGTDVVLTRTVGDYPERIAAYVAAHLLADALDLPRVIAQQAAERWERWPPGTLAGKTMLVVGFGAIGRRVAEVARSLGMVVRGVRRGAVSDAERAAGIHDASQLGRLLPDADVIVNLLPATPETRNFWGADRWARVRDGATFVNASRGQCVDDAALLEALGRGRPARAILDVFDPEPLPPGHPYWRHPSVRVTPHVAGIGTPGVEASAFVENWKRWIAGAPLANVVDRERGY